MNAYLFVAAAVLSVVPVVFVFKSGVNKLLQDPSEMKAVQKSFFIGAALSKIIPAILLVYGIIKMTPVDSIRTLLIPIAVIIITVFVSFITIEKQKNPDASDEVKMHVNTLVSIARPHLFSVPVMAVVFLFLMTL